MRNLRQVLAERAPVALQANAGNPFRGAARGFIRTSPGGRCTGRTVFFVGHFRVARRGRRALPRKDTSITVAAVFAARKCGKTVPVCRRL